MNAVAHVPVLMGPVTEALAPLEGATVVDATFGAGGYTRALLAAGVAHVVAIDRDPTAIARGQALVAEAAGRLTLVEADFARLEAVVEAHAPARPDAVVFDVGVSSMQLDRAERGFSFRAEGPLDMRMGDSGPTAAEIVNASEEAALADILHFYGEERAARRIARAIVRAREAAPIETTGRLAEVVASALPPARPGQVHPATRSFQALRIAVNDELGQLVAALNAAERVLGEGGRLAVVTFHSLEDRIVKRFLQIGSGRAGGASRHEPTATAGPEPRWERPMRPRVPDEAEIGANPRARSARLRAARRTAAPAVTLEGARLGLPVLPEKSARRKPKGRGRR